MEIQLRKQAGNMGDFAENKLRAPGEVGFWGVGVGGKLTMGIMT